MTPQIYVKAVDLPDFVWENFDRLLKKEAVVAENTDTGYEVRVRSDPVVDGRVLFRVLRNGECVQEEDAIGEDEVFDTYRMLNLQYLFPVTVTEPANPLDLEASAPAADDEDDQEDEPDFSQLMEDCHEHMDLSDASKDRVDLIKDVITLRDDDLLQATRDYMEVLAEEELIPLPSKEEDKLLSDLLEHILIYLSVRHGISVWRPTIYEGDQGGLYLDPYPYTQD